MGSALGNTGQRPNPNVHICQMGYRGWIVSSSNQKDCNGLPKLPRCRSGYREERDWFRDNRHLNNLAESISVNVGGFYRDVKVSSPPMTDRSVGGVIVVRARENREQGEGRQSIGKPAKTNRMQTG
jgi:hypothetical protein